MVLECAPSIINLDTPTLRHIIELSDNLAACSMVSREWRAVALDIAAAAPWWRHLIIPPVEEVTVMTLVTAAEWPCFATEHRRHRTLRVIIRCIGREKYTANVRLAAQRADTSPHLGARIAGPDEFISEDIFTECALMGASAAALMRVTEALIAEHGGGFIGYNSLLPLQRDVRGKYISSDVTAALVLLSTTMMFVNTEAMMADMVVEEDISTELRQLLVLFSIEDPQLIELYRTRDIDPLTAVDTSLYPRCAGYVREKLCPPPPQQCAIVFCERECGAGHKN